jgi:hypothetical protein
MPTDDQVNASDSDAYAQQNHSEIPDEVVTSHPRYKELEEKHSAARTGMDKSNLTKKQLEAELAKYKMLAGEEEPVVEKEDPPFVTKKELEEKLWKAQHSKDLELYGDETYLKDVEEGIPAAKALEYAKLRYEKTPNNVQVTRQQSMASSGSTSTRNLSNVEITDQDREDMKQWGFSEKTLLKQKAMKKARGL